MGERPSSVATSQFLDNGFRYLFDIVPRRPQIARSSIVILERTPKTNVEPVPETIDQVVSNLRKRIKLKKMTKGINPHWGTNTVGKRHKRELTDPGPYISCTSVLRATHHNRSTCGPVYSPGGSSCRRSRRSRPRSAGGYERAACWWGECLSETILGFFDLSPFQRCRILLCGQNLRI